MQLHNNPTMKGKYFYDYQEQPGNNFAAPAVHYFFSGEIREKPQEITPWFGLVRSGKG